MDTTAALTILRLPIADLHPDPANARAHGERNLEAIRSSLARFGQAEPLVVQKSTRRVIGGNGRLAAMKALGWSQADVVELDLDDVQATALGIALNRTGELAEWDMPALGKILESLQGIGALDGVGFSEKEVSGILDDIIAAGESLDGVIEDGAPLPGDAAVSLRGDIWIFGKPGGATHRLMCGDSSSRADLDRLLGGQRIQLVNSDPPYNVKVEPRSNNAIAAGLSSFAPQKQTHHQKFDRARNPNTKKTTEKMRPKDRPLANDFVSDEAFDTMLRAWFGNFSYALEPGRAFYIWGGYANCANYPSALVESELYFSQALIWIKGHPVLTRKDFMGNHEWCFYGWKEGAAHVFLGPNNVPDVWEVKKLNHTAMVHLTEKPVELAVRAIQYSSRPGENVLDLFSGSASTLSACEQTGRNGYAMELDELYCDVGVERMQKLTGCDAILEGTKQSFAEVRAERSAA